MLVFKLPPKLIPLACFMFRFRLQMNRVGKIERAPPASQVHCLIVTGKLKRCLLNILSLSQVQTARRQMKVMDSNLRKELQRIAQNAYYTARAKPTGQRKTLTILKLASGYLTLKTATLMKFGVKLKKPSSVETSGRPMSPGTAQRRNTTPSWCSRWTTKTLVTW